jgi:hypothetical protein
MSVIKGFTIPANVNHAFLRLTAVMNNAESGHATAALAFRARSKNFEKRL